MNAGAGGAAGPAPLLRSTWLLIRLRLRRLGNQVAATRKPAVAAKKRAGNPGKQSSNVLVYLMWPVMLFGLGSFMNNAFIGLHRTLDAADPFWQLAQFSPALVSGAAFLLMFAWFASLLLTIGGGELAKGDWDLEWLITLPIRSDTLLWARILERSVVNPSGVAALLPACTVIAWYSGLRWAALPAGLLAALPLLMLAALGRTLIDTGLRLSLRASQLRNLSAVISVLSIVSMYLLFSMGIPGKGAFMLGLAADSPGWFGWTPMGLIVRTLDARGAGDSLAFATLLAAQVALLLWLGVRLLRFQLRHGVVAGGARESGPRAAGPGVAAPAAPAASAENALSPVARLMSPVQRRELTLLSRDRNFMVQSLVLPLLIVGGQLLLGQSGVATTMWRDPNVLASVAFGLAAYSLSLSAFQTLNTEGHALWLLYTFPQPIEAVLKDKAKLWGVLTLVYPTLLFAVGMAVAPTVDAKFLGAMLTAYLGIPIYGFIAVALGVYGSRPLEQVQGQKIKPAYLYLYMMLAGLYIYAVVTPDLYQRLVFMVLTLLLSFALWQKARDQLPYLLDPDASPPARVSTSDGLIAAMVFFVIQGIGLVVAGGGAQPGGAAVLVAFTIAGAASYALMRYVYARAKTRDVPRILGAGGTHPLFGAAAGLGAALVAIIYLLALARTGVLESALRDSTVLSLGLWAVPLAVLAAPLFEEFLFRGLIFGGLRRSFGLWPAALASAAIFAVLHPPISVVPVFALGIATALAYERSRSLLAPMIAHAVYNACVMAAQPFIV